MAVTVTDDDTAGATVSETTLTVDRGRQRHLHGEAGRAAHLRRGDRRNQERQYRRDGVSGHFDFHHVQLEHGADGDGALRLQDADAVNDAASIAHAVDAARSADEYDAVTIAGVAVTVTDDDAAGATVSETTLTVAEGGSATYTVVLDAQPTSDVVINVTASGNTDVTVSPATLTFTRPTGARRRR